MSLKHTENGDQTSQSVFPCKPINRITAIWRTRRGAFYSVTIARDASRFRFGEQFSFVKPQRAADAAHQLLVVSRDHERDPQFAVQFVE